MKVSIVIVSYKVPYHLILCLNSLNKALENLESEILVIDNASEDNTSKLVAQYHPEVKFIQNELNEGFSKANNRAIKQAKGEYICLVNPDTIVTETLLDTVLQKHQSKKNIGILGVRLIDGTGNFLPESKINKLTLKVAALKLLGFSKSYFNNNLDENSEGETSTLVGAFMCFKKENYLQLDGLDERYFMYGEDIDLSYQFIKAGFKNYYLGSEKMIHFKGESTLRDEVYFKRFFDSVKLFFTKHYSNSKLLIGVVSLFFYVAKYFKKSNMAKKEKTDIVFDSIYLLSDKYDLNERLKSYFNKEVRKLELNDNEDIDGFIIQLPLPPQINTQKVLMAVNPEKDVDGFHPMNFGKMALDMSTFIPATPFGILELLDRYGVETDGKHTVIIGRSHIVGRPMSILMGRKGFPGNSTVTLTHSHTKNITQITSQADIIISALGIPQFLKAEMVKDDVVIIDVGITRVSDDSEKGYYITGDVDFENVSKKASFITPVPGGVGPMTIAMLLKNTLLAREQHRKRNR